MNTLARFFTRLAAIDTLNVNHTHVIINKNGGVYFKILLKNCSPILVAHIKYPTSEIKRHELAEFFISKGYSDHSVSQWLYEEFLVSKESCTILWNDWS